MCPTCSELPINISTNIYVLMNFLFSPTDIFLSLAQIILYFPRLLPGRAPVNPVIHGLIQV